MTAFLFVLSFLIPGSWRYVPDGAWEPGKATMSAIRSGIKPFVVKQASAARLHLKDWSSYAFEYQGRIKDRHKIVFISGVCHLDEPRRTMQQLTLPEPLIPADEWYYVKQFHIPAGGGTCVFHVSYDPKRGKFFDLEFNGVG